MKLSIKCVALMALVASSALAGDFVDTRVVFAVANSNVFVKPGEGTPSEPGTGIGAASQNTQFYDNFNTRFTGFETLSNVSLYKKSPSFFEGFEAEAALNINVLTNPTGSITLFDNASFVKLNYKPAGWGAKEDISFTGFPVSSDRFRLGYAWKISWAGDTAFTGNTVAAGVSPPSGRPVASPGAKLQVTRDRWYAFMGAKTALLLNGLLSVQERQYGALLGGGIDLLPNRLRLEMNGGYFTRGIIPSLAQLGVRAPANAMGGSMQVSFFSDSILPSLDLRLYKNDPDIAVKFFQPETYRGGLSYQLSLEGSVLRQSLQNPERFASTRVQSAGALALQARFKYDFWRFYGIGLMRTLSFILFDTPSAIPFLDFPDGTRLTPELWFALGGDRFLPNQHLTIGLVAGIQTLATQTGTDLGGGNNPPANLLGTRTQVFRSATRPDTLPEGARAQPIYSLKATFKLDISEYFAALGEAFYNYDRNRVSFLDSTQSIAQAVYQQPHQLGFNLVMQARF